MLEALEDRRVRITYDRGTLEIVTPSPRHESRKSLLGSLVACLLQEREMDYRSGGSSTLKRQDLDRGLEPDECFWIENWEAFNENYELDGAPPPDLVLEVEVSRTAVSRMGVYAAMLVPEVWRLRVTGELEVWCLEDSGEYGRRSRSPLCPDLDPAELADFVRRGQELSTGQLLRLFRARLASLPGSGAG